MENQRVNDEIEIDLLELLDVLLSRIWLILSAGLFVALVFFIVSRFIMTPYYSSTTKIYILNKKEDASVTYNDVQLGTQLTKDYAELINSRSVLEEVKQKLSLTEGFGAQYKLSVSTPADTRIISITVQHEDPVQAMNIANCIREVASEHIQNIMDIEAVNVVETANMPTGKAGPNVTRWTMIGGAIGVILLCAVILVQYLMDDTIKSSEDIEKYLGLSTLALIPVVTGENDSKKKTKKRKK